MISVSLSGALEFLSPESEKPVNVIDGHKSTINCIAVNSTTKAVYTGCNDGFVIMTNVESGQTGRFAGKGHDGKPVKLIALSCNGDMLTTVGSDGTYFVSNTEGLAFPAKGTKLDGAPRCILASRKANDVSYIGTHKNCIYVLTGDAVSATIALPTVPQCVDSDAEETELIIGGEDGKVYIWNLAKGKVTDVIEQSTVAITSIRVACDGKIAIADVNRNMFIYKRENLKKTLNTKAIQHHQSAISALDWSPDGQTLTSVSLDADIFVWTTLSSGDIDHVRRAFGHTLGITGVQYIGDSSVVTISQDACIKVFNVPSAAASG
eukprot:TRINITY_DN2824_c0_g1_i1.p1 TRINITY_DN2824_c0_g1~~TRINITY_DN2824_c0_g1_i1.p1  ORF type:complete len:321 (+),score=32.93 TRINITY_DN2824_c0_g1_i1:113-1075(+)